MAKNTENPSFFEFQKIINRPESADEHIKSSGLLEIPEFFVGSEPKIHEIIQKMLPPPQKRALLRG